MAIKTLIKVGKSLIKKKSFAQVAADLKAKAIFGSKRLARHRVKKARKSQRTFNRKANSLVKSLIRG